MPVIFDLKEKGTAWANSVNQALEIDSSEYIKMNGEVGSNRWWTNYDTGNIACERKMGVVTFVGNRFDHFNEIYTCVEIEQEGQLVEFDRCGYWKNDAIVIGASVFIESFKICVTEKYGTTTFIFERLIEVHL